MPKRTISEIDPGVSEESAEVIVTLSEGCEPITWHCDNYTGDETITEFTLLPGVDEAFPREYAKRVFGDWEQGKRTIADRKAWADMVKDRVDRSPTSDGKLPMVKIVDIDGALLWDAKSEYEEWMSKHGAKMLPRPDRKAPIKYTMPKILDDATKEQLEALWKEVFDTQMPGNVKHELIKELLMPRLTEKQIADVIAPMFEVEPDMSQYERKR